MVIYQSREETTKFNSELALNQNAGLRCQKEEKRE